MFGKIKNMFSLDKWIENFEGYVEARLELLKYDFKEQIVSLATSAISVVGLVFFALVGFAMLNFGIAYLLNFWIQKPFAGFFILSAFYFCVAFVFYLMNKNKTLHTSIENIIREGMDQPRKEEKEEKENEPD